MAEVRKHKPGSNPIMEAITKAMGEPVRPVAPGDKPKAAKPAANTPRVDIFTAPTTGFTVPAPKKAADED
ncbi:hypothetical protein GCM10027418_28510 [Mariniluteicoccus endophyticus]